MTPVAAGVELHHTHIMFDASAAKEHLQAAKRALSNDKNEVADAALVAVQRGVNFAYTEVDLPLLRARENLMLAKSQVQAGQAQEARMTLEAAAHALEQYAQQGQQTAQKSQQAVEQINQWWDRIVQLADQA
jgi:hypothetical protein